MWHAFTHLVLSNLTSLQLNGYRLGDNYEHGYRRLAMEESIMCSIEFHLTETPSPNQSNWSSGHPLKVCTDAISRPVDTRVGAFNCTSLLFTAPSICFERRINRLSRVWPFIRRQPASEQQAPLIYYLICRTRGCPGTPDTGQRLFLDYRSMHLARAVHNSGSGVHFKLSHVLRICFSF